MHNIEEGMKFATDVDTSLRDFYYSYKPWEGKDSVMTMKTWLYDQTLSDKEKEEKYGKNNYYQLYFSNKGWPCHARDH
jgi:hypothetical protein